MKSAMTTMRATPAITAGFLAEMRHQHEEGDASAGAEQHRGADEMQEFQNEIEHLAVLKDGKRHEIEDHDRPDLQHGAERIDPQPRHKPTCR